MTAPDHMAQQFRDRRMGQQLSMRDVEARTAELAEADPTTYAAVSRQTVSQVELLGMERLRQMEARNIRALVVTLFGSLEAFVSATGYDPQVSAQSLPEGQIPVIREGVKVLPNYLSACADRDIPCLVRGAQFAVEVGSPDLAPVAYPGNIAYAHATATYQPGALHVIERFGRVMLAHAMGGQLFQVPQSEPFRLSERSRDRIIGVVIALQPMIPAEYLREDEAECRTAV